MVDFCCERGLNSKCTALKARGLLDSCEMTIVSGLEN